MYLWPCIDSCVRLQLNTVFIFLSLHCELAERLVFVGSLFAQTYKKQMTLCYKTYIIQLINTREKKIKISYQMLQVDINSLRPKRKFKQLLSFDHLHCFSFSWPKVQRLCATLKCFLGCVEDWYRWPIIAWNLNHLCLLHSSFLDVCVVWWLCLPLL